MFVTLDKLSLPHHMIVDIFIDAVLERIKNFVSDCMFVLFSSKVLRHSAKIGARNEIVRQKSVMNEMDGPNGHHCCCLRLLP